MRRFLVVKVNCSSSDFNDNQTHLNIEEDQNDEQIGVKASESVQLKICVHSGSDNVIPGKTTKTFLSVDRVAEFVIVRREYSRL